MTVLAGLSLLLVRLQPRPSPQPGLWVWSTMVHIPGRHTIPAPASTGLDTLLEELASNAH